jgi:hypothetical protein
VVAVVLEVRPHPAVYRGAAGTIAAAADWPVDVAAIEHLPVGLQPIVRLALPADRVGAIGARMASAADLEAVLADPQVADGTGYKVEDIATAL